MREIPNSNNFKPSEFMRARRPALFSDSIVYQEPRLSREMLEYHLETLTNRKQETDFEHFCRKLAEKELCPNLLPQTGPTGGGDSKVDTETYPLADALTLRWYQGIGREAAQERWAFAFSAKKKWRPKVDSDVAGIVATQRGYKLIYFITNQYVRDKSRAAAEDALRKKHGIEVRILDRNWIIETVFKNDRIDLVIETLRISGFEVSQRKQTGPRDTEWRIELDTLEKQINDPDRYAGVEYQLVEDCLQATLLARQLGLPRVEVDGRFQRAERNAERVGDRQQMLRVFYKKAWTAFWWYDDFQELNQLYNNVEKQAIGTAEAYDLELLANLWTVMGTSIFMGKLDPKPSNFAQRTKTLKDELTRLAADERRPTNALQARTISLLMDLNPTAIEGLDQLDSKFTELKEILLASRGLGSYPIEPVFKIIRELGEHITNSSSYDSLFECLIDMAEQRASEVEVGKTLLQRGIQKLNAGKNYEAIRLLGRAQLKLAKDECREEWIIALGACGSAYEAAGLIWAARASSLAGASIALSEFTTQGLIMPLALVCIRRLVWLEMQLGRVPHVLMWAELMMMIAHHLRLEGKQLENFLEERTKQDMVLGLLLLKTDFWESKWLDFLPFILERLGFDASWMALLYILGHEDRLRSEKMIPAEQDIDATREFFLKWTKQPAADDLPEKPEYLQGQIVSFTSVILGCRIVINSANTLTSIYLSETILSVLEAFLATGIGEKVFAHRAEFLLAVRPADLISDLPEYHFDQIGRESDVEIKHGEKLEYHSKSQRLAFRKWLIELIAQIIARVFHISDSGNFLTRLARDEAGFDRALEYSDVSIFVENIFGQAPKFHLSDWEREDIRERFPLKRQSAWNGSIEQATEETISIFDRVGEGDPPKNLLDIDRLKHRDIKVFSLINQSLWDKAGWKGTAYIWFPESEHPPYMALGFADPEVGKEIFFQWRSQLGKVDFDEQLRVSIITGIDKHNPFSYKVMIGVNPKIKKESASGLQVLVSRIHQMDPPNHTNLNNFIEHYERTGRYILLPIHFSNASSLSEPFWNYGIAKSQLSIRPAWQIGEHDPDIMAIQQDADPIIPDGVENPPVLQALKRWK